MTPEERALEMLCGWFGKPGGLDVLHTEMLRQFAAAIGEAVAEEREACARTAEAVVDCDCMEAVGFCECYGADTLRDLAAAIRARG